MAMSLVRSPLQTAGAGSVRRDAPESRLPGDQVAAPDIARSSDSPTPRIAAELSTVAEKNSSPTPSQQKLDATTAADVKRRQEPLSSPSGVAVLEIDATPGPVGFGDVAARRVGRPFDASLRSENLFPFSEARYRREESGGVPAVSAAAPVAKEAFRHRNPAALSAAGPSTEAAIEAGLAFLARHQLPDGSWTLGQFDSEDPLYQSQLNSDTAATGLALLAFQGAGYNHREFKYAVQIKTAIDWLIANQADDGGLYISSDKLSDASSRMYSHAIAALALTEAYGMTQDADIKQATQKALDYIADTQDPDKGGWRYFAQRRKRSSDTSVTGWMMMALQSGRLAGLQTNTSTLEGIEAWLRVAEEPAAASQFRYNPYAVDSDGVSRRHGRQASVTMTSVGLLMRVYSGWGPEDERLKRGAAVLLQQLPGDADSRQRDTYYWYYATQVMKHVGGSYWERWNASLHPLLIDSQQDSGALRGSWHPYHPVPDRWGPQGGRLYVTTMNLLSLEVRYRLLPLYEKTIR